MGSWPAAFFVRWVRRTHGWFGLWGALLGLMAGTSGIWLNHRSIMKLELPDQHQTNTQLAIPEPRPETANAMTAWLQQTLKADRPVIVDVATDIEAVAPTAVT